MRIRDAMILVFLLCLIGALSVNIETMTSSPGGKVHVLSRLSAGFPFRSIEYTRPDGDTPSTGSASKDAESDAGVRVERPLLVCDAFAMALIGVLLAALVLPATRAALAAEVMVGVVAGALALGLGDSPMFSRSWLSVGIGIVLLLVVIPLSVCALSERHKHPNVFLVVLSCVGGWAFMRAGFITVAVLDGDSMFLESPQQWRRWLGFAVFSIVLIGVPFVMRLFGTRVPRRLFQRRRIVPPPQAAELCAECNIVSSAKVGRNAKRRIAVAATLLAATLYVGEHFAVVRDLRDDDFRAYLIADTAIDAKLGEPTQPLAGTAIRQVRMTVSTSFRGGINARYQEAVLVNDQDICYVSVEKHLLIPWVHVEVFRIGTVARMQRLAAPIQKAHPKEQPSRPSPVGTKDPPATERKE
jgi:hypothetical protein